METSGIWKLHNILKTIALLALSFCFIVSCREKSDDVFPVVSYLQPSENSYFSIDDTIRIVAEISDNEQISSIEVVLTDENFVPVLQSYSVPVKGNPMTLIFDYPIDDYFIESGIYNLLVKVSDGLQTKNKYQRINIGAPAKELIGVALGISESNRRKIIIVDSNFSRETQVFQSAVTPNFIQSLQAVAYHNTLAYKIELEEDVVGLNYINKSQQWIKTYSQSDGNYIYNIISGQKNFYVFQDPGSIKIINYSGNEVGFINDSAHLPLGLIEAGNYYIVHSIKQRTPFTRSIRTFLKGGNTVYQSYYLDFIPSNIFYMGDNKVIIIGNSSQGELRIYDIANNSVSEPYDIGAGYIYTSVQISQKQILLVHDGSVKIYDYQNNTLTTYQGQEAWTLFAYEPLNNGLFYYYQHQLKFIDLSTRQILWSRNSGTLYSISHIVPLYNR